MPPHTRPVRADRGWWAWLTLLVLGATLLAPVAQAEDGGDRPPPVPRVSYRLDASARLAGTAAPYRLRIEAVRFGTPTDLVLELTRRHPGTTRLRQLHTWSIRGGHAFGCQPDLSRCRLGDRGSFGDLATVRLEFQAVGKPAVEEVRCPTTGDVVGIKTEQRGRLVGTIALDTRTRYFGVVGNGDTAVHTRPVLAAHVTKFAATTTACPAPPRRCPVGGEAHTLAGPRARVAWFDLYNHTFVAIAFTARSPVDGVSIGHQVIARPAAFILDEHDSEGGQRLAAATLRLSSLAPVVSGDLEWEGTGKPRFFEDRRCQIVQRRGVFSGEVVATIDGLGERSLPASMPGVIAIVERR